MMTLIFLLFGLSFNLHLNDLFQNEKAKELQKLQTSAENALKKDDLLKAKEEYREITSLIDPVESSGMRQKVDWTTYVDTFLRYGEILLSLKEYEEGKKLLLKLSSKNPPSHFLGKIDLLMARYLAGEKKILDAFLLMKNAKSRLEENEWKGEDRSFFHALSYSLQEHYTALEKKAFVFFLAGFFNESSHLFEELARSIEIGVYKTESLSKIKFSLASCHAKKNRYLKGKRLLEEAYFEEKPTSEMLFLSGKIENRLGNHYGALEYFSKVIQFEEIEKPFALYEMGVIYLNQKKNEEGAALFSSLLERKDKLGFLSRLQLAKLALSEKKRDLARKHIEILENQIEKESTYLATFFEMKGRLAQLENNLPLACEFFENAYSIEKKESLATLLAFTYLQQAKSLESFEKKRLFEKAEGLIESLRESSLLPRAHLCLFKKMELKEKSALSDLEALFAKHAFHVPLEDRHKLLLYLAEAKDEIEEKEKIFLEATLSIYKKCESYPLAWMLFGLHKAKQALLNQKEDLLLASLSFFDQACEKSDANYLKALVLAKGGLYDQALSFLSEIESNKNSFNQDFLFLLANLYYKKGAIEKAKEHFLTIADFFPEFSHSSLSLFWAAQLEEDQTKKRDFHKKCYSNYGDKIAALSFLSIFSFEEYLEGKKEAIDHLLEFEKKFNDSHFQIISSTLLGLHSSNKQEGRIYFEKVLASEKSEFSLCHAYFYFRAKLELAKIQITEGEEDIAITSLEDLKLQLKNYLQDFKFFSLYEESQYHLIKSLVDKGKFFLAKKGLAELFASFKEKGIEESYFVAKAWQEEGRISLQESDFNASLYALQTAEKKGASFLSQEEKLEIWLLQSEAYLGQNRSDLAMRMLSKVINEDAISNLRLKAMYLRASVYEREKRYHLAFRQLEALAKKGGEWSVKAKEKLRLDYGIDPTIRYETLR